MKLCELFGRAKIEFSPEYGDIEIKNIVTDARRAVEGSLFVCIKGLHFDGHEFIDNAINNGASVILCERVRDVFVGGAAIIEIENTRNAIARLYNAWYGDPASKMRIVGITGTNGKTSVCEVLAAVFSNEGYPCATVGTLGFRIVGCEAHETAEYAQTNMTTPDPDALYEMLALAKAKGVRYVFMEVSSHSLALNKCDAIYFDAAVFTNLTRDHLDFHGNMENYFAAKKRLFSACRMAIINADDAYGREIIHDCGNMVVSASCESRGDYNAENIRSNGDGSYSYELCFDGERIPISLKMGGRFAVNNTLLAASVAIELGLDAKKVASSLSALCGVSGRMQTVRVGYDVGFSVIIDYAHTPDALENLLRGLDTDNMPRKVRTITLFGCGGERDRGKRRIMAGIASRYSDFVIVTSDNNRSEKKEDIIADILRGIDKEKPYAVIPDRKNAIIYAIKNARQGDRVILAGKGHEKYEIDQTGKHPFDEEAIAREAILKYFPEHC